MFNFQGLPYVEMILLMIVELVSFIYLLNKYKKNSLYLLVILLFYQAIFMFLGKEINNLYKIVVLLYTIKICFDKKVFDKFKKGDVLISFLFVAFSLFYAYAVFSNRDDFTIIFSQYSRYLIIFCLWFLVRNELYKRNANIEYFHQFIYDLFLIQIFITIGKFIIFQGQQLEGLVGSLTISGGSLGTTLPIVGFIMIWFLRSGNLKRNDWLFIIGLMLIGFMAGKRAIWFVLPIVIAAFMIYIPKLKVNKTMLFALIATPLAFYFGVRLTPTLNPEGKVWGNFDYDYAIGYADKYQFGDENKKTKNAQGRGGATALVFDKFNSSVEFSERDWIGSGLSIIYKANYESFNKSNLGVESKGNGTGLFQTYITTGYLGVFSTLLYYLAIFWQVKKKRLRWVLIAIVTWEYFLYIGDFFRSPALMFMMIYFIHYSNYLIKSQTKRINNLQYIVSESKIIN